MLVKTRFGIIYRNHLENLIKIPNIVASQALQCIKSETCISTAMVIYIIAKISFGRNLYILYVWYYTKNREICNIM